MINIDLSSETEITQKGMQDHHKVYIARLFYVSPNEVHLVVTLDEEEHHTVSNTYRLYHEVEVST